MHMESFLLRQGIDVSLQTRAVLLVEITAKNPFSFNFSEISIYSGEGPGHKAYWVKVKNPVRIIQLTSCHTEFFDCISESQVA